MSFWRRSACGWAPNPSAPDEPPQNMKEYDPEWARSFWTGLAGAGCDHLRMLSSVKVPILLTHHFREIDPATGGLMGAVSDQQVACARKLVTAAGQAFEVVDLPEMAHAMHAHDPQRFTSTIVDWTSSPEFDRLSPTRSGAGRLRVRTRSPQRSGLSCGIANYRCLAVSSGVTGLTARPDSGQEAVVEGG